MKASQRTFLVNISRRKIVISPRRKVCFCDKQVARTLYYYIMKLDENPWFAFNWKFIKLLPPATKTESQKMILTTRINRAISRVSTLKKLGLMRKILATRIILSGCKDDTSKRPISWTLFILVLSPYWAFRQIP